jgi:restriction endonuclease S subunit
VFAVKRGEVEKRCDVVFNHPKYVKLPNDNCVVLRDYILTIDTGRNYPQVECSEDSIKLIRTQNIRPVYADTQTLSFIEKNVADKLTETNDLMFVRVGVGVGDCCVIDDFSSGCAFSDNTLRVKLHSIDPEFVAAWVSSTVGKALLIRSSKGSGKAVISSESIENIVVPNVPLVMQKRLCNVYRKAYQQCIVKLREADELLAGMDRFVREIIGLPEEDKTRSMLFAVKISHKEAGRIDPEFHNPFYQHRIKRIKEMNHDTLGNIIEFSSETWNQKCDFEGTFPYIEISGVGLKTNEYEITQTPVAEAPSRAKMIVRNGDIIVSTTRPHRGAIATINCNEGYYIASTGFCVLRKMKRNDISPEYLQWVLLNDYVLQQFLQRSSGGNYPAIIQDEMKKVVIPIPDKDIQNKIVKEAIHRKSNAHQLKREAEAEWAAAKTTFEQELLGGMDK